MKCSGKEINIFGCDSSYNVYGCGQYQVAGVVCVGKDVNGIVLIDNNYIVCTMKPPKVKRKFYFITIAGHGTFR